MSTNDSVSLMDISDTSDGVPDDMGRWQVCLISTKDASIYTRSARDGGGMRGATKAVGGSTSALGRYIYGLVSDVHEATAWKV